MGKALSPQEQQQYMMHQQMMLQQQQIMAGSMQPGNQMQSAIMPQQPPKQSMHEIKAEPWSPPDYSCCEECYICGARFQLCICPCYLCSGFQVIEAYEMGVVLRLGRRSYENTLAGGMHLMLPGIDELLKIDIREQVFDMPKQQCLSREGVNLTVDGVIYYKVFDANRALLSVQDVRKALSNMALTKVRETVATHTVDQMQQERQTLAENLRRALDDEAERWGIDVTKLLLTEVTLPPTMQDAKQAQTSAQLQVQAGIAQTRGKCEAELIQAENQARTQVIKAEAAAKSRLVEAEAAARSKLLEGEGEEKAALGFKEAADIMSQAPGTLQIRFLNTISNVGNSEKNTIMVPYDPEHLSSKVSNMKVA